MIKKRKVITKRNNRNNIKRSNQRNKILTGAMINKRRKNMNRTLATKRALLGPLDLPRGPS